MIVQKSYPIFQGEKNTQKKTWFGILDVDGK